MLKKGNIISKKYRLQVAIRDMERKREKSNPRETGIYDRVLYFLNYLKQLKV